MSNHRKPGKRVTWDKFCDKFNNYIMKNTGKGEDFVCIVNDMEDPTTDFDAKHTPEELTEYKEKNSPNRKCRAET